MTQEAGAAPREVIAGSFLIDAHVHCHRSFAATAFLDSAAGGFREAAGALGPGRQAIGWLLFAELPQDHYFDALRTRVILPPGWVLAATSEDCSLIARKPGSTPMILLAGRQITTREGLEVLALGSAARFVDGRSLTETVDDVRGQSALAVLPWGFGKWWGRRGQAIADFIEAVDGRGVFLGDNAGRPAGLPRPAQFAQAAKRGIFVLPGSDPLPLPGGAERVARYGLVLEGAVDPERPTDGLRALLVGLRQQPATYGSLPGLPSCLARQVAMQWRKRRRAA